MLIDPQRAWLVTVVLFIVEKEKLGAHQRSDYSDTYARMLKNAEWQLVGSFNEFLKHWSSEEVTAEEMRWV